MFQDGIPWYLNTSNTVKVQNWLNYVHLENGILWYHQKLILISSSFLTFLGHRLLWKTDEHCGTLRTHSKCTYSSTMSGGSQVSRTPLKLKAETLEAELFYQWEQHAYTIMWTYTIMRTGSVTKQQTGFHGCKYINEQMS